MNTIIINENKNNYTSYLYKLNNFSYTKKDITDIADITSDNHQNIPTSYSSTYYVNSNNDNSELLSPLFLLFTLHSLGDKK